MPNLNYKAVTLSKAKQQLVDLRLQRATAARPPNFDAIPKRRARRRAAMSPALEKMWLRSACPPNERPGVNEVITLHRQGSVEVPVLEGCFAEILRRHEAW